MSENLAGCPGKLRIGGGSVGVCYLCARYGVRSAEQLEPAATIGINGVWTCDNRTQAGLTLTADQVAAVDEQAGLR